ncbi:MAG: arginine--tRNA ligase [bacterium]|nr:arginine--tRNA ligase [bacterium]
MEEQIREAVEKALAEAGLPAQAGAPDSVAFTVERPTEAAHGDYATNAAMVAAKALKRSPKELAVELVAKIKKDLDTSISSVQVAGSGFINITLSAGEVVAISAEAAAKGPADALAMAGKEDWWGKGKELEGQRVMVEYSNPNAFKEMHVGHLIGTIVGEAMSRLIENEGAVVARDTFGGDVGPNVAKALWALRKNNVDPVNASEIGEAYAEGAKAYEENAGAKAEIDALNQEIYARSHEIMSLWNKGREISMEEFRRIWQLLGSHFDYEFFDSDVAESGVRIVRDGLAKGIFKESDGAIIYDGEAENVHTMVFITSHGTPTYEAKDMGLAFLREERWPSDRIIIVTGNEQNGRFKTVFAALVKLAPKVAAKTEQIGTGFLRLTTGKMSSREGSVITAAGLIKEVMEKAGEKNADPLVAEQVAIGAIKYMILRQAPGSDIIFDPEKSLSLEGDSGPYLQYALVRAVKILSYESEGAGGVEEPEEPYAIERLILHYPEIAARAARLLAPNVLTTYLTELASAWNAFYASHQVLGSPEEAYKQRVTRAFANTMANGLRLLGIPAPERM